MRTKAQIEAKERFVAVDLALKAAEMRRLDAIRPTAKFTSHLRFNVPQGVRDRIERWRMSKSQAVGGEISLSDALRMLVELGLRGGA
jgi:hypothetical protein